MIFRKITVVESGHKYPEVSVKAVRNCCWCMQTAHIISRLSEMRSMFRELLTGSAAVKYLPDFMTAEMRLIKSSPGTLKFQAWKNDEKPEFDQLTRRWLKRRCLLTDDDYLAIPVLGKWLKEY